jgi:hypothetical protein
VILLKLIKHHLYSFKNVPTSLLAYDGRVGISGKVMLRLWPINSLKPAIIDILKFVKVNDITSVEIPYFEAYMNSRPVRRYNLMKALWSIKW